MKKSVIAIGAGAFVLVTAMLCMNPEGKMYQKQKHFDSVKDVLVQLENNNIQEIGKDGRQSETNEFKECLSKRKRLTFSQIHFGNIEIEKIEDLDENQKQSLLEEYDKAQKKVSMPYKPSKIEPVRLDIKAYYPTYGDGKKSKPNNNFIIDLVMVDEGEGMVIDYYVQHYLKDNKDKEGQIDVKG